MIEQLLSPAAWGSPVGLGIFMVCMGLSVRLLTCGLKDNNLDKIIQENMNRKKSAGKKKG